MDATVPLSRIFRRIRNLTATLLILSGILHIAQLWLHDISPELVVGASLGALYLIIGIGLYGQSRFVLFTSSAIPAVALWLQSSPIPTAPISTIMMIQTGLDYLVISLSLIVLVAVRNNPSP